MEYQSHTIESAVRVGSFRVGKLDRHFEPHSAHLACGTNCSGKSSYNFGPLFVNKQSELCQLHIATF
jgi:hypothetical protein